MLLESASKTLLSVHHWGNAMHGKYIIITVLAITCGAGAAGWRAASQIGLRIQAATHLAAMAQLTAEEKAKAAELAQGVAEAAERFAREELARERNAREAAEQALDKAVSRTAQAALMLSGQASITTNLEGDFAKAQKDPQMTNEELIRRLAVPTTAKKIMVSKLNDLDTALHTIDEMMVRQAAAGRQQQSELDGAKNQVRDLSLQLHLIRAKAEAQAPAGKRAAAIKAREAAPNRPQAENGAAANAAQKRTEGMLLPARKPQASWQESSAP
jgi:hypothetical protein